MEKYKIQELVQSGFDFDILYPEKVEQLKSHNGYNFGIGDIVSLIKKQTSGFTIEVPVVRDIDNEIFNIYQKWWKQHNPEPEPQPEEPKKQLSIDDKIKGYQIRLKRAKGEEAELIRKKIKAYELKKKFEQKKQQGGELLIQKSVEDTKQ